MRKEKTLFIMGLWIVVLQFLGFPNTSRKVLLVITGFLIIYLAYLFYIESKMRIIKNSERSKTFVDNIESSK